MRLRIHNIDIEIDKMVGQMRTIILINVDANLTADISEICYRTLTQTVKSLPKTINENL